MHPNDKNVKTVFAKYKNVFFKLMSKKCFHADQEREKAQFKCCVDVCYLAGRQSSSTVDVSVKVKGCFRYTAAVEIQKCSSTDLRTAVPQLTFSHT